LGLPSMSAWNSELLSSGVFRRGMKILHPSSMEKRSAGFPHTRLSVRLWLLGSPPDQVHGLGLHGTRPAKGAPTRWRIGWPTHIPSILESKSLRRVPDAYCRPRVQPTGRYYTTPAGVLPAKDSFFACSPRRVYASLRPFERRSSGPVRSDAVRRYLLGT